MPKYAGTNREPTCAGCRINHLLCRYNIYVAVESSSPSPIYKLDKEGAAGSWIIATIAYVYGSWVIAAISYMWQLLAKVMLAARYLLVPVAINQVTGFKIGIPK